MGEKNTVMPQNVLSTTAIPAPYIDGEAIAFDPLVDSELGGVALRDGSEGLRVKQWTVYLDGDDVMLGAADVPDTVQFSLSGITELSLAFDTNMNPTIAFVRNGQAQFWWFDTLTQQQIFTSLPFGAINPRVTHDDKRAMQSTSSDVILGYLLTGELYMRMQRDRYGVDYPLQFVGAGRTLEKIAMNTGQRLQWQLGRAT
jgi:hypothetical protein